MSGFTTLPSLHQCDEELVDNKLEFTLKKGVSMARSASLRSLTLEAARATTGVVAGLTYMGACAYARTLGSVGASVARMDVRAPINSAKHSLSLLFSKEPHLSDRFGGLMEEVSGRGVELEQVEVVTEDGYILVMHRMRNPKQETPGPVVFLQHGLKGCSADWTIGGLAYSLVERGYDVWMGNFRGNYFSHRHQTYDFGDAEFWDFSFEEHGHFDLPAMLETVLGATGCEKLTFVGHSMGSTAFFVLMSERGEQWAGRIKEFIALAPVATINAMTGFPSHFFEAVPLTIKTLHLLGLHFVDATMLLRVLPAPVYNLMGLATAYAIGYHELDFERARHIFRFNPNPTSTETLRHFIECKNERRFRSRKRRVNNGDNVNNVNFRDGNNNDENEEGDFVEFDLAKTTCRVRLWYAEGDWVSSEQDCKAIAARLPNCESVRRAFSLETRLGQTFGHQDFTWARDTAAGLYREILDTSFPQVENLKLSESEGAAASAAVPHTDLQES